MIRFPAFPSIGLPQFPRRDETDADQLAPAPDQAADPPHLTTCGQRKAEHLRHGEVADIQTSPVLGNVEDVAFDPRCIGGRNQKSRLVQVDPDELAGTEVFAVSRHDFSCP